MDAPKKLPKAFYFPKKNAIIGNKDWMESPTIQKWILMDSLLRK